MRNENPAASKEQQKEQNDVGLRENFIMEFRKLNIYTTAVRRS